MKRKLKTGIVSLIKFIKNYLLVNGESLLSFNFNDVGEILNIHEQLY